MIPYILCFILFSVGVYAVLLKRNIMKMIIGIALMGYAINLLMVMIGYRFHAGIPIVGNGEPLQMVDPMMQSIVLVTIVIELATTVLLVSLSNRLFGAHHTMDSSDIRELHG